MLHIVAPLRKYEGYENLIASPADEFYVGMIPPYWEEIYGSIGLNRRDFSFCNLHSFDELDQLVQSCHEKNKLVSITLNNHYYTREQEHLLKRYIADCAAIGVDSLIVADPTIVKFIKDISSNLHITISSEAGCYSAQDILFFAQMGVQRIIFPRDMTIHEMGAAIQLANQQNMEYEAFIYGPRCTYSGSYCTLTHGLINGPSFCSYKLLHHVLRTDGQALSTEEVTKIDSLLKVRNLWASNRKTEDGPLDSCGICAIYKLGEIGVNYLKVVGREYSLDENLDNIQKVNSAIINGGNLHEKYQSIACKNGLACYYSHQDIVQPLTYKDDFPIVRPQLKKSNSNQHIPSQNNKIEVAVLCNDINKLDANSFSHISEKYLEQWPIITDKSIHRIYLGNEFCAKKVPSLKDIQTALEICLENGWAFTLLLPPLTTSECIEISKVVNIISAEMPLEIVCNSWGALYAFCGQNNVTLILGRLLNKVKHDPSLYEQMDEIFALYKTRYQLPQVNIMNLKKYYSQSNINVPTFNQMLHDMGVVRIETDVPYQQFTDKNFYYTLYHPIQYVTFGRYCLWGAMNVAADAQKFRPDQSCGHTCDLYISKLTSYNSGLNLFSKGCAVFSHKTFTPTDLSFFNRIVIEPSLPI